LVQQVWATAKARLLASLRRTARSSVRSWVMRLFLVLVPLLVETSSTAFSRLVGLFGFPLGDSVDWRFANWSVSPFAGHNCFSISRHGGFLLDGLKCDASIQNNSKAN
jgi:hypothetical protein